MKEVVANPICSDCGQDSISKVWYSNGADMFYCLNPDCRQKKMFQLPYTVCPICFSSVIVDVEHDVTICSNHLCPAYRVNARRWKRGHTLTIQHKALNQEIHFSYVHEFHTIYSRYCVQEFIRLQSKFLTDVLLKVLRKRKINVELTLQKWKESLKQCRK